MFVHEYRHEAQKQLQVLVKKTKEKQVEFKSHSKYLAKVCESNSAAVVACKRELNAAFDQIVKTIESRRKALLMELEALSQSEEKMLNAEMDYIELALAHFSNSIQFTEKLFDNEDDVEMMLMSTQARPALVTLQKLTWDQKKAEVKPLRMIFDQKDLLKCKSIGSITHSLKDSDVVVSGLPAEARESFSFEVFIVQEVSKLGVDFTPTLSVLVTHGPSQVKEPIQIQNEELNKWKIICKSNGHGQHEITVKVDTVVKVRHIRINPKMLKVGMKVVRGPDWDTKKYGVNEDGGEGNVGEVVKLLDDSKVHVTWPNGRTLDYQWGKDNKYDLKVV